MFTHTQCVDVLRDACLRSRFGRLLTWSLGAAAANDFLQAAFAALSSKANQLEQEG